MSAGWYPFDFARGRPTNPARIPVDLSVAWYYTLSYAVLLFGNLPNAAQASGLLSILASGVALAVLATLCSSRPFLMIVTDGTLVATLASTVVVIEADMRGEPATAVVATVLARIVIAGICTGASLIAPGRLHAGGLVADERVIQPLTEAGKTAVIPPKANRQVRRNYDRHLFQARHLIENFFARLKQFRAIATRYDKTKRNFLGAIHLAAAAVWLN